MNDDGYARLGDLPGSFGSGETAADNVNGFVCHALEIGGSSCKCNAVYGLCQVSVAHKKTALAGGGGASECRLINDRPIWEGEGRPVVSVEHWEEEEKLDEIYVTLQRSAIALPIPCCRARYSSL